MWLCHKENKFWESVLNDTIEGRRATGRQCNLTEK